MALQFFDGFEGVTVLKAGWSGNFLDQTGRYGGRAAHPYTAALIRSITPATTVIVGGAFRYTSRESADIIQLFSGTTQHIGLGVSNSGYLQAKRGSTVLATSAGMIPTDGNWYYIELKANVHDTTGIIVVRVNGVEWLNYTGDTRNGGTTTDIDYVRLSRATASVSTSSTYQSMGAWDDFYIADTTGTTNNDFLGDLKVEVIRPTGPGNVNAWVGSDGDSIDNHLLVAESTPNTTDYVASSTFGARDLYEHGNLSTLSGTIKAVQTSVYAQKSDAGLAAIKTVARLAAGTESVAANPIALTDGWATQSGPVLTTSPAGAAWTVADVNGAQFGYEVA